jgi:hypothetical protein
VTRRPQEFSCDYCGHRASDHAQRLGDGDRAPCKACDCGDFESEAADNAEPVTFVPIRTQRLRELEVAEGELNDWRQPNMLTEVEYRERTAKLNARIAQLERVREAADVARHLRRPFSQESLEQVEAWRELDAALEETK